MVLTIRRLAASFVEADDAFERDECWFNDDGVWTRMTPTDDKWWVKPSAAFAPLRLYAVTVKEEEDTTTTIEWWS